MSDQLIRPRSRFDRFTRIGELGDALHVLMPKLLFGVGLLTLAMVLKLFFTETPGWLALACIGAGTCVALVSWQSAGTGLPLLPLIALQHLIVYGVPLVSRNEVITGYPEGLIDQAGFEVLVMLVFASVGWLLGMRLFSPFSPTARVLRVFVTEGNRAINYLGVALIVLAAGYELLNSLGIVGAVMGLLPAGTHSIVVAMINAAGMSGYFLVAMFIASGEATTSTRNTFWIVMSGHLVMLTSSLLLSSVINIIGAVVIGLFWGSGRLPKRFLITCAIILSFLNLGKFEMRERYWGSSSETSLAAVSLTGLPGYYAEWIGHSYHKLFGPSDPEDSLRDDKRQTMLARVDNMQNLLFAVDGIANRGVEPLRGATYSIIPPLLIPRVFWSEKPRTHEGQVMLNVHFQRQSRAESFTTYIAWGLLPEAYGNFGSVWGAAILGLVLGLAFAWIENATSAKPLLSLEGLVTFAMFIGIAASFEMVSSVLITSLFQSAVTITIACLPFVQTMVVVRPSELQEDS